MPDSALFGCVHLPGDATKAALRLTNPKVMLNDAVVVQNEVASMMLTRHALATADPPVVPCVYG